MRVLIDSTLFPQEPGSPPRATRSVSRPSSTTTRPTRTISVDIFWLMSAASLKALAMLAMRPLVSTGRRIEKSPSFMARSAFSRMCSLGLSMVSGAISCAIPPTSS
ncbi:MAG: hypothetical protein ACD_75C01504G0001 [uncultured bacterium]|nr:MAG: hypothetical protein ACD_75C01504G0001 [uncultured bacterium]